MIANRIKHGIVGGLIGGLVAGLANSRGDNCLLLKMGARAKGSVGDEKKQRSVS